MSQMGHVSDDTRAAWLRVVQGWLGMIRKRPQQQQPQRKTENKPE
jgi:hypothetical protein